MGKSPLFLKPGLQKAILTLDLAFLITEGHENYL